MYVSFQGQKCVVEAQVRTAPSRQVDGSMAGGGAMLASAILPQSFEIRETTMFNFPIELDVTNADTVLCIEVLLTA